MRRRIRPRYRAGLAAFLVLAAAMVVGGSSALAVTGAVSTTDNPGFPDPGALNGNGSDAQCLNGQGVNCNIYTDKTDVWFSGLPIQASLGAGTYFFSVQVPGGQPDPNDGGTKNLSDLSPTSGTGAGDTWVNRVFSVDANGILSYTGNGPTETPHLFDSVNNKIQVFPYDDTTNPGGVYILAVCKLPDNPTGDPGVSPQDCKYDAFKVVGGGGGTPPASDLTVTKDAATSFTRTFGWTVTKGVDACQVTVANPNGCQITGNSKTLNYSVTYTKDGGTDSVWQVAGTISVLNSNTFDVTGVDVTDAVNDGGTCVVTDSSNNPATGETISAGTTADFSYTCTFAAKPSPYPGGSNTATATWDAVANGTPTGSADFTIPFSFGNPTTVSHNCVTASDTGPSNGTVTSGAKPSGTICGTTTFTYGVTVSVPHGCVTIDNTASFTATDDSTDTGSASVTAKVCRVPATTGALTMGFWQNKNGQGIVKNYSGTNCQSLRTWLNQFHPFSDLTATTCGSSPSLGATSSTGVIGYVYTVIKAASCTSTSKTCNSMLKAQMLATALNVYFSDTSLGGNRIGAPGAIGAVNIDLTQICHMIDGTGGTATCSGTYENVSSAFGGATSMTVMNMLLYQNTSDPLADAGAVWYGQVKATQVLAKDAFDAINNKVAFTI